MYYRDSEITKELLKSMGESWHEYQKKVSNQFYDTIFGTPISGGTYKVTVPKLCTPNGIIK